jgi:histidinol dehydrogenase
MRIEELESGIAPTQEQLDRKAATDEESMEVAAKIIADVRMRGDEALRSYGLEFDGVELKRFRVADNDLNRIIRLVPGYVQDALSLAAKRIRRFHEAQVQQSSFSIGADGVFLGTRITPIESVGIYIPGGRASYPSTVLMNAIPASVAGVPRIVMATPPGKNGMIDPVTLAAAKLAGVTDVYAVGCAQAIAALAYGTDEIPAVDKITGPGNKYVTAAKRLVSGDVGIDMLAGPSEVLILADETAEPSFIAIDLMAQAEHDPQATTYLVTTEEDLVDEVIDRIEKYLATSPRQEITKESIDKNCVVFVCPDLSTAILAVNTIAPEHLEIQMDQPMELLGLVKNAGAIFLGPWTPESVGDYLAGPNHTLPTGGTARFSSPLSVADFIKRTNVISYSYAALQKDARAIADIAKAEGLWAHGKAVDVRFEKAEDR